ncbi:MAG: arylsulfotransferase family protein [Actinomycetota bacterium]|nr:arylsulfotransferase family protein [Actinomycetota bacterium]
MSQDSSAQSETLLTYRSRPDLRPPAIDVAPRAHDTAPGYLFVGPKKGGVGEGGPMILDNHGQPVWFRPMRVADLHAMDFKVQTFRGKPVITWVTWDEGEYVILDDSYREVTRIRAGNGYLGDHHEFHITARDTALITIYSAERRDLSSVGGPKDGRVAQGIVQELDIDTGEVLFEWHSLDHVGIDETYAKVDQIPGPDLDYFHINSIDVDHDDNLIVSARSTFAVYKIDRQSGEVIWRLGGKKSNFEMGPGTPFAYQHDARRQPGGTITIFDNGTTVFEDGVPTAVEESRGIELELDEQQMSAVLVREYTHPDKQFAHAGGNLQRLPNGNVLIGWGRAPVFSEFGKGGELLFSASFPPDFSSTDASYRAFRFPWSGQPTGQPAAAAERTSEDKVKVYASWNGATEVATWEVLAGPSPGKLESLGSVPRGGFETAMLAHTAEPYVSVRAKTRPGQILGTTGPIKV